MKITVFGTEYRGNNKIRVYYDRTRVHISDDGKAELKTVTEIMYLDVASTGYGQYEVGLGLKKAFGDQITLEFLGK